MVSFESLGSAVVLTPIKGQPMDGLYSLSLKAPHQPMCAMIRLICYLERLTLDSASSKTAL